MKAEEKFPTVISHLKCAEKYLEKENSSRATKHKKMVKTVCGELRELLEFLEAHQWRAKETLTEAEMKNHGSVLISCTDGTVLESWRPFTHHDFTHWQPLPKGPQ